MSFGRSIPALAVCLPGRCFAAGRHRFRIPPFPLWGLFFFALRLWSSPAMAGAPVPMFETDIRPILKARCFSCHGEGDELKSKLDLRLRRTLLAGGKSGPAIVPGAPDKSLLYEKLIRGEMPKDKGKLSAAEIDLIRRWIASGAPTRRPEPADLKPGHEITPEERTFWSFQPIRRPAIPSVQHAERVRSPIDALVLRELEQKGLTFAPEADKLTLIRRVTLDLTGLPPTPEEVEAFLNDDCPDAYPRLVDRLLASPRYGERWGRHWLDVAGYADSDGYVDSDPVRKYAWHYRDYVIRAFNNDMPFDRFIREQLAGDEMVKPPYKDLKPDQIDKLIATGFLRMAPDGTGAGGDVNQVEARNAVASETIKIVSTSLLGLTVGCAQCHNHKYDPIPQSDYYRFRAIFEPVYDVKHWRTPQARLISLYTDEDRAKAAKIEAEAAKIDAERLAKQNELVQAIFEKELAKLPESLRDAARAARNTPNDKRTPEQVALIRAYPAVEVPPGAIDLYDPKAAKELKTYTARAAAIRATKPAEDFVQAATEVPGVVPDTYVFARGDPAQPKEAVAPAALSVLADAGAPPIPGKDPSLPTTGRRLAYAKWLTSGKHPLVARVLVNRAWMRHFGHGVVDTPGDFGALGDRPSNPALLDWLADEFMARGWSLKTLQREILLSSVYRQSSRSDAKAMSLDPDDRLLWRMPVRRLDAEAIRDSVLAVTGKLNDKMFGPPVPVALDESGQTTIGTEMRDGDGRIKATPVADGGAFRRSIYLQARRTRPLGILEAFDSPAMNPNCIARNASTVAPQSLTMMNGTFMLNSAKDFARRVIGEAGADRGHRITRAWRLAFGRGPSEQELAESNAFLAKQEAAFANAHPASAEPPPAPKLNDKSAPAKPADPPDPQFEALASFCQALLSSDAFLYVD
jgi:hypothetical protein